MDIRQGRFFDIKVKSLCQQKVIYGQIDIKGRSSEIAYSIILILLESGT